ncbi:AbrB family transcriptional regulator [Roseibium polysiphoniae]|nr:AbrB family transcriptional regulator [Roseibium polysiphoniae]
MSFSSRTVKMRAATLAVSCAGTAVFYLFDLPLPFLFGPMIACLLAALSGMELKGFGAISVGARSILGVAIGASISPALFANAPAMAGSIALVPIFIGLCGLIGVPFFQRVWGFDRPTAYYAAMPGGLQDMVIFGTEAGGNARSLSLVHATRILFIVTIAPVLLVNVYGAGLSHPLGEPVMGFPLSELLIMSLAAIVGWKGGERIGLFGASILGPMIVTAILSLTDVIHMRPPREAILAAQFLIGAGIGVHFVGMTLSEFRWIVSAGLSYVAVLAVLSAVFSWIVMHFGLGHPIEAFLAFAPGGQAEMTVLAIVTGSDLGFVIAHHLTRIVLVITGAPLIAAIIQRARPRG